MRAEKIVGGRMSSSIVVVVVGGICRSLLF